MVLEVDTGLAIGLEQLVDTHLPMSLYVSV